MKQLVVYFALASTLIGLGYNWRRVDEVAARSENIQSDFVRKDVISAQFADIQRQLDEIKVLVARPPRTTGSDYTGTGSGQPSGRMFDK